MVVCIVVVTVVLVVVGRMNRPVSAHIQYANVTEMAVIVGVSRTVIAVVGISVDMIVSDVVVAVVVVRAAVKVCVTEKTIGAAAVVVIDDVSVVADFAVVAADMPVERRGREAARERPRVLWCAWCV